MSLEYLKNAIVSYMCTSGLEERKRMVPAIAMLLRLSPEEQSKILQSHVSSSWW